MSFEYWCERLAEEGEAVFADDIKAMLPSKLRLRLAEKTKEVGLARQKLLLKWSNLSTRDFRESNRLQRVEELLHGMARELTF
jgi:hypothetical protein